MLLNVTCDIYTENSSTKRFFNLNVPNLKDIDAIKKSILENLKIDDKQYTILKDGIDPEKDIQRNVKYWVKIEKK